MITAQRSPRCALLALLIAVAWIASVGRVARGQEPLPLPRVERPIRVLFFNTHLLPAIAQVVAGHRGQDDYRTPAIAARLPVYDLVGLCEVFEAGRRQEIVRTAQEMSGGAYHWVESPPASGRSVICGGLLLLSRFPIEGEPHVLTYTQASRLLTNGLKADGLAAKGVLHARLLLRQDPPVLADCFLTHLESVSSKARAAQIAELSKFITTHASPDRPVILMGDLNVEADFPASSGAADSEYRLLTGSLRQSDPRLCDLWAVTQPGRGGTSDALAREECRRIDYVFLSQDASGRGWTWSPSAARVEPFLDANIDEGSLSDHAGIACELTLQPPVRR